MSHPHRIAFRTVLRCVFAVAVPSATFAQTPARSDTIVKLAGAPRHPGGATLVAEVTIGGGNASDEYLFDGIRALLAAKDGSIWVADGKFPFGPFMVRQFDASGKFLRNIGRKGDGPGEWQYPFALAQMPDGRVILRDDQAGKPLTLYKPDGKFDTTWAFMSTTIQSILVDTEGFIWMRSVAGVTMRPTSPPVITRRRADGSLVDTVAEPPYAQVQRATPVSVVSADGRTTMGVRLPYQPGAIGGWSPFGYYARGVSTQYTIDLLIAPGARGRGDQRGIPVAVSGLKPVPPMWHAGDQVLSIRRNVPPVAVSDAERADQSAFMDAQATSLASAMAGGGARSGPLPDVPRTKQPIRSVQFGNDGRVWVSVSMPSERYDPPPATPARPGQFAPPVLKWREPIAYDVFEPDGSFLGRIVFPWDVGIVGAATMQTRGDTLWCVVTDEDGVQMLRRYKIVWK